MSKSNERSKTLLTHQNVTIACLRERLEILWWMAQQKSKGVDPKLICRRVKISQAQFKPLLAEHRRFEKFAYIAKRISHREPAVLMKGDRASWAKFLKQVKKQDKFTISDAGFKKTLLQHPRNATMRNPLNLYYMIEGVVHGRWKHGAEPLKLVAKVKLGQ